MVHAPQIVVRRLSGRTALMEGVGDVGAPEGPKRELIEEDTKILRALVKEKENELDRMRD